MTENVFKHRMIWHHYLVERIESAENISRLVSYYAWINEQVARQRSPTHDAEVVQEVRKKIGDQIELRVDANRNWTYKEAMEFGSLVKECDLQYIEVYFMDS